MSVIKYITEPEFLSILSYLPKMFECKLSPLHFFRCKLLLLLMYDAGLRVGEVSQLTLQNLYYDGQCNSYIDIPASITKNKLARCVPLTTRLRSAIVAYCEFRDTLSHFNPESYLFAGCSGRQFLSTRRIQLLLRRIGNIVLQKKLSPHMLRHSYATRLMRVTSMSVVQHNLGHKRLSSTGIYLHPSIEDAVKAVKALGV